ncbi:MAG TPA: cbb3-type cytochrome c oxidase subunit II [Candidatus Brocadiia bacterium]|nr:cytochrome c [Planctomycetota bacterium]MDO8092268.1 cytochrome c [Candidatus Brocadiales bacterium]
MERFDKVFFIAGIGFFAFAYILMGIGPWTTLRGLKPPDGVGSYTDIESRGRNIYIREGCWHCHTQFVRPVRNESERYGALSEPGEYMYDIPQLFGTRRTGPDLSRVGGKYDDNWHYLHILNPRSVVRDSVMPPYPWLYDKEGKPTKEGVALVAYLQRLGKWARKEAVKPAEGQPTAGVAPALTKELLGRGKGLYEANCVLCHGERGDGKGLASQVTPPPADFTDQEWKYGGKLEEIFHLISNGVPGTMMPPWKQLPETDRWALVYYVKAFSE